jgi:hypothetical protein
MLGKWETAVSKIVIREMRLKAFAKSNLTSVLSCTDRFRKVQARTVDGNLGPRLDPHAQLGWPEHAAGVLLRSLHQAFCGESAEDFTDGDGPDPAVWLWDGNQTSSGKNRRNCRASPSFRQQVHQLRQVLHGAVGHAGRPRLTEVLHS